MGISPDIATELHLLGASLSMGGMLSLIYGIFLLRRMVLPEKWLLTGIEDFLYWTAAGFAVFYLLYRENDGALRLYVIAVVLVTRAAGNALLLGIFGKVLKMLRRCFKIKNRSSRYEKVFPAETGGSIERKEQ